MNDPETDTMQDVKRLTLPMSSSLPQERPMVILTRKCWNCQKLTSTTYPCPSCGAPQNLLLETCVSCNAQKPQGIPCPFCWTGR